MKYFVEIKEEHIIKSRKSCIDCPMDIAIKEQTDLSSLTLKNKIQFWHESWVCSIEIPIIYKRALDFISRFDSHKSVRPFGFEFDVPGGVK